MEKGNEKQIEKGCLIVRKRQEHGMFRLRFSTELIEFGNVGMNAVVVQEVIFLGSGSATANQFRNTT